MNMCEYNVKYPCVYVCLYLYIQREREKGIVNMCEIAPAYYLSRK